MNYFKVFMDIDEQLINKNNVSSESEKAGELRESRRSEVVDNNDSSSLSFREQIKQKKNLNITNEKRAEELIERDNPIRKATDGALKFAWENLITSWGLTLLYIDLHVFLNKVFGPKVFRELGEEWIPASIKKLGDGPTKKAAAMLSLAEKAGCGCLNLGCLFLIIAAFTLVAMIVSAALNPWETLWNILIGDGGIKGFIDMIKSLW
jgi:hypothetical protein